MLHWHEFFGRSTFVQFGKGSTAASQAYPRRCGFAGASGTSAGNEVGLRIRRSRVLARQL